MTRVGPTSLIILMISILVLQCKDTPEVSDSKPVVKKKRPVAAENGKFFERDGKEYLWGGEDSTWHFDITDYSLKDEQFHYGIGRERFHALIDPKFIPMEVADTLYADSARFLVAKIGNEVKAYAIDLLTHHEVVNDMIGGEPVMATYCILADLGAIYHRNIGGKTYTFALSGYTYYDSTIWDGMDGFVLWDRETESLWWPLIGEAVSGMMKGVPMCVYDERFWAQTDWRSIKETYTGVQVLASGQIMEPPKEWTRHGELPLLEGTTDHKTTAPRWGENRQVEEAG